MNQTNSGRPLDGVRVVELGRLFAAPWATMQLADLGAEVIKVELPGRGDEFRHYGPPFLDDEDGNRTMESGYYLAVNRNKRSITVDMTTPEGQEIIRGLVAKSDIVVENFKVGDLARYGLDYAGLKPVNPAILYCSVTGFGQTGPYASRPGTDSVFQALSGMMDLTGDEDGAPMKIGFVAVDFVTGMYGAIALLAALRRRDQTGEGEYIDLALLDTAVAMTSHRAMEYLMDGAPAKRHGNGSVGSAPANVFRTKDGLLNVQAGAERQFDVLCRVLDMPELRADPRFATRAERYVLRHILEPIVEARFRERTTQTWYDLLVDTPVIVAPVLSQDQTFADPQVVARELRVDMAHPIGGSVPTLRSPIRFVDRDYIRYDRPPLLGEDNDAVLGDLLGYAPDQIAQLKSAGAI